MRQPGPGPNYLRWGLSVPEVTARLLGWFVERRIAAPDEEALGALIVTARRTFEDKVLEAIASSLSPEQCRGLDASLTDEESAPVSRA